MKDLKAHIIKKETAYIKAIAFPKLIDLYAERFTQEPPIGLNREAIEQACIEDIIKTNQ